MIITTLFALLTTFSNAAPDAKAALWADCALSYHAGGKNVFFDVPINQSMPEKQLVFRNGKYFPKEALTVFHNGQFWTGPTLLPFDNVDFYKPNNVTLVFGDEKLCFDYEYNRVFADEMSLKRPGSSGDCKSNRTIRMTPVDSKTSPHPSDVIAKKIAKNLEAALECFLPKPGDPYVCSQESKSDYGSRLANWNTSACEKTKHPALMKVITDAKKAKQLYITELQIKDRQREADDQQNGSGTSGTPSSPVQKKN